MISINLIPDTVGIQPLRIFTNLKRSTYAFLKVPREIAQCKMLTHGVQLTWIEYYRESETSQTFNLNNTGYSTRNYRKSRRLRKEDFSEFAPCGNYGPREEKRCLATDGETSRLDEGGPSSL